MKHSAMRISRATLFVLLGLALSTSASAAGVDIGDMFKNAKGSFEALTDLVRYACYIIGIYLVIGSIFKFSELGSSHGGHKHGSAKAPLIMFISGIGLFALTGSIGIMSATMSMGSGPGDILAPSGGGLSAQMASVMESILIFIRLLGYIAFARGWLILNSAGQGKNGVMARAIMHLVGGVAAINVQFTASVLANTFAPGLPMPF